MFIIRGRVWRLVLQFGTLSHAPIREALIGIHVPGVESDLGPLEQALRTLPADYQTKREPITLAQTQLTFGPDPPESANIEKKQLGWRFGNKNGRFAVQARTDWLIFSHLAPYTTWTEFSKEAHLVWAALREIYAPSKVRRVSVRNLNEVDLGMGENVEKYLKFFINVPEGVPQEFNNYFARIELHQSPDIIAILQSGLLSVQPAKVQLLLDIELLRNVSPKTEQELWEAINGLREPKNQIFFSCITKEWEAKLR